MAVGMGEGQKGTCDPGCHSAGAASGGAKIRNSENWPHVQKV